ncbi:hypothetical protein SNEBB_008021 [Seison nebaliae]|nr:hypothetical protein SNEBB_008021 [Seison nebaliae]
MFYLSILTFVLINGISTNLLMSKEVDSSSSKGKNDNKIVLDYKLEKEDYLDYFSSDRMDETNIKLYESDNSEQFLQTFLDFLIELNLTMIHIDVYDKIRPSSFIEKCFAENEIVQFCQKYDIIRLFGKEFRKKRIKLLKKRANFLTDEIFRLKSKQNPKLFWYFKQRNQSSSMQLGYFVQKVNSQQINLLSDNTEHFIKINQIMLRWLKEKEHNYGIRLKFSFDNSINIGHDEKRFILEHLTTIWKKEIEVKLTERHSPLTFPLIEGKSTKLSIDSSINKIKKKNVAMNENDEMVKRGKHKKNDCRRLSMIMNFDELDLHTIIAPKVINAFMCKGFCSTKYVQQEYSQQSTKYTHSVFQSMIAKDYNFVPDICCRPSKYSNLTVMRRGNDGEYIDVIENAIVEECACH